MLPDLLEQLKALADDTRLKIFKLIQEQELCVCQIVPAVGLAQPTVSIHLAKLKRAGLVKERRSGQWAYYSVDPEGLARFQKSLKSFLALRLADIPEMEEIAVRVGDRISGGGQCCPGQD